jgi:hypothetical protein
VVVRSPARHQATRCALGDGAGEGPGGHVNNRGLNCAQLFVERRGLFLGAVFIGLNGVDAIDLCTENVSAPAHLDQEIIGRGWGRMRFSLGRHGLLHRLGLEPGRRSTSLLLGSLSGRRVRNW